MKKQDVSRFFLYDIVFPMVFVGLFFFYTCLHALEPAREREAAVFDISGRVLYSSGILYSIRHALDTAGVPYMATSSLDEALTRSVIFIPWNLDDNILSTEEEQKLSKYVYEGGVLCANRPSAKTLFPLFGVTGTTSARVHTLLKWNMIGGDPVLEWFDEALEQTISLGDTASTSDYIPAREYSLGSASPLAYYENGAAAVAVNRYGDGSAYCMGVSLKDMVLRNLLNFDLGAARSYSNGFEPGADAVFLFFRALFAKHVPYSAWLHTSPYDSEASLIITHDVDADSSMILMSAMAEMERSRGLSATYFITTHYIKDEINHDYYTPYIQNIRTVASLGHSIGSHSVGHFRDFASEERFPVGSPGLTRETYSPGYFKGVTTGGVLFGELEVSKNLLENDCGVSVRSFRSGHLVFNKSQINVMNALGYVIDSSQSANDILTNFPFFNFAERSFSSSETAVLEIPLTISDVGFDENTQNEALAIWRDVLSKNAANHAPTVLLVHPTRKWKQEITAMFVDTLESGIMTMAMEEYGDFWKRRHDFRFKTYLMGTELTVVIPDSLVPVDRRLSLIIEDGRFVSSFRAATETGKGLPIITKSWNNNDILLSFGERPLAIEQQPAIFGELKRNFPNPFNEITRIPFLLHRAGEVEISVYAVNGQKIRTVKQGRLPAGSYSAVWDGRSDSGLPAGNGIYFSTLSLNGAIMGKERMLLLK